MKLSEFITSELIAVASSDIRLSLQNGQSKMILTRVKNLLNDLDEEEFDFEKILASVGNDKQLASLRTFRWHIEEFARVSMYYGTLIDLPSDSFIETDIKKVNEQILSQPGNRLLPLFWLIYKLEYFKASESFTADIVSFYKTIFKDYDYLVDLDDFFRRTNLLYQSCLVENPETSFFIPVFRNASERYPEKLALKLSLARFLYDNQDYNGSVEVLESVCNHTEKLDNFPDIGYLDSFFYDDYIYAKQFLAILYDKLGDSEKVQLYADQVINFYNETGGEDNLSYIESFFLRMRINMKKGEFQKVMEDYQIIKSCLDLTPEYFQEEFGDVLKFVEQDGKQKN